MENNIINEAIYNSLWKDIVFYECYSDLIDYDAYVIFLSKKYSVSVEVMTKMIDVVKNIGKARIDNYNENEKHVPLILQNQCDEEKVKINMLYNRMREELREAAFDEPQSVHLLIRKINNTKKL